MTDLTPKCVLPPTSPSFYDLESVTLSEMAARLHSKLANHEDGVFEAALRQEFQDFIDIVNMKYGAQEKIIDDKIAECIKVAEECIAQIDSAIEIALSATYTSE